MTASKSGTLKIIQSLWDGGNNVSRIGVKKNHFLWDCPSKAKGVPVSKVQGGSDISGTLSKLHCRIEKHIFFQFFCFKPSQLSAEAYIKTIIHIRAKLNQQCRIPIRHFFSQSRWLLTKIFESVTTVNEKCRCLWIRGQGAIKRGCYARYLPFPPS